jgi:hypothetical protein
MLDLERHAQSASLDSEVARKEVTLHGLLENTGQENFASMAGGRVRLFLRLRGLGRFLRVHQVAQFF